MMRLEELVGVIETEVDTTAQLKPHRRGHSKMCYVTADSHEVGVKGWSHTGQRRWLL